MGQPPIVIRERMYVPKEYVSNHKLLTELYTRDLFSDQACSKCEYLADRITDACETCPHYLGHYKLYNERTAGGVEYYGLPLGDREKLREVVPRVRKIPKTDLRKVRKIHKDIEFTGKPYDYQVEAVDAMIAAGYGNLVSPPRSGKTVMGAMLVCKLKVKTLILASQHDYLEQFYETFCGGSSHKAMTNIRDIEKFNGKKICGIAKSIDDFAKYDVCLATYQTFISAKGQKRFKRIQKLFSCVIIDEVQTVNAKWFAWVVSNLVCRYKFGMTGTFDRKDCLPAGTLVKTPKGEVSIETLKVGDTVITHTGSIQDKNRVVALYTRHKSKLVRVTYEGGYLICTPDHKLWCVNRNTYVEAKDITASDSVLVDA